MLLFHFKDGMGHLKIVPGGIQLTGQALVMDTLRASTIRSRPGQPIAIGNYIQQSFILILSLILANSLTYINLFLHFT